MKFIALLLLSFSQLASFAQKQPYLLVGTYTGGKSEGIYVYSFDTKTAESKLTSSVTSSNPSFLAVSTNKKYVYAVNENKDGMVSAYSFDAKKGSLNFINSQSSGGKDPCYISVDASGKWAFVGNYSSGSVAVMNLKNDGSIGEMKQLIEHAGSGPDSNRQQSPHVHATVLSKDQKYLYTPDLGTDKLMVYHFRNGKLNKAPTPFARSTPGSGPRHIDFDPANKFAYLMEEMSGTVMVYKLIDGKPVAIQRISALPKDFKGRISSADIHVSPDGDFLYCSNRGESNSIAIFKIDRSNGKLSLVGHHSTLGKTPRNFNFDPSGRFLLVANQDTDEIVIFKIDQHTGLLSDSGQRIQVPSPVCLKWIQ